MTGGAATDAVDAVSGRAGPRAPRGVFFLANDRVVEWSIAFLNSFRTYNRHLPLCLIPFDEQVSAVMRLRGQYHFSVYEDSDILSRCDRISRRFHDHTVGHYRKLAAWHGPFDEFIYIDVDTVVLAACDFVFDLLWNHDVIAGTSNASHLERWVWKASARATSLLSPAQRAYAAGTGFVASKRGLLTLEMAESKAAQAQALSRHMNLECQEQPFLNYLVVTTSSRYTSLSNIARDGSSAAVKTEYWAGRRGAHVRGGLLVPPPGVPPPLFVHWAGQWPQGLLRRIFKACLRRLRGSSKPARGPQGQALAYAELWSHYHSLRFPSNPIPGSDFIEGTRAGASQAAPSVPNAADSGMPGAAGRELYRAVPFRGLSLGGNATLVYEPIARTAHVVPHQTATRLASWQDFADSVPIELLHGTQELGQAEVPSAAWLRGLEHGGLLLRRTALLQRPLPMGDPPAAPIGWLAIPTRSRPFELRRAAASYSTSFRRFHHGARILIVGDDVGTAAGRATREALDGLPDGPPLYYIDRSDRERFADSLAAAAGVPPELARFAVLGSGCAPAPTIGAARNTALLATAGERMLFVDDDTICSVGRPADVYADRLALGNDVDPTEFWFHTSRSEAFASTETVDIDPLGEHARFLGTSLPAAVRQFDAARVDCTDASPALLAGLWHGTGRVRMTANGVVGDSGMYSGAGLRIHAGRGTRARLLASESAYQVATRSREVLRQALTTTLGNCHLSSAMFLGLDNRELLPPFMPAYRSEDTVFGETMSMCLEGAVSCHLPWALQHDPTGKRSYAESSLGHTRMSDIVIACMSVAARSVYGGPGGHRLAGLGRELCEFVAGSEEDAAAAIAYGLRERAFALIASRETLVARYAGQPAYWARDVRQQIEGLCRTATDPRSRIPVDLSSPLGARPMRALQKFLLETGKLLQCWPALVQAAQYLKHGGLVLGRRVR